MLYGIPTENIRLKKACQISFYFQKKGKEFVKCYKLIILAEPTNFLTYGSYTNLYLHHCFCVDSFWVCGCLDVIPQYRCFQQCYDCFYYLHGSGDSCLFDWQQRIYSPYLGYTCMSLLAGQCQFCNEKTDQKTITGIEYKNS